MIGFILLLLMINLVPSPRPNEVIALNVENGVENWDWKFIKEMDKMHQLKHHSYFVDTEGCRMPSFPAIDKDIEKFLTNIKPVNCGKRLTRSNQSHIWIDLNETEIRNAYGVNEIEDLQCQYNSFERITDVKNEFSKLNHTFKFGDIIEVNDEFIYVTCKLKSAPMKVIYKDYDFFPAKHKQSPTPATAGQPDSNDKQHTGKDPMSVMIIGIDTVSRLHFHRRMKESANELVNNLNAIELFGFNKLGDNSYPNIIPVLSGLNPLELAKECVIGKGNESRSYDRCNFIWKDFKAKNFTTVFAEDVALLGLFNGFKPGFVNQSTDLSFRPAIYEMESNLITQSRDYIPLCIGKRRIYDILMEYAEKVIDAMDERLYFSYFWTTSYTHDDFNFPQLIDADFADFLRRMRSTGALDNLFLIVMSDHGMRWGPFRNTYQGAMEERQPFVFFVPPKRFAQEYPEAMRNLVRNRHALTTHFDLYDTLRDLANLESIESNMILKRAEQLQESKLLPRGISLFLPVPESRSCSMAAIAPHWCTCHEHTELNKTDPRIIEAARIVIDHLNGLLKPFPQCHTLELSNLLGGSLSTSNIGIRNGTSSFVDITIRLQTKPGLGEFEATARIHDKNRYELTGTVSRTNLYGTQSKCINDPILKLYCFCKNVDELNLEIVAVRSFHGQY